MHITHADDEESVKEEKINNQSTTGARVDHCATVDAKESVNAIAKSSIYINWKP